MRGLDLPERTEDFTADPVELFFDLAYVFAFSQLVALLLGNPTWEGVGQATLLFMLLWLPWSQFTWSANAVPGNQRSVRLLFLVATAASVPMAAAVGSAFGNGGGGILFAVPLAVIFLTAMAMLLSGLPTGGDEFRSAVRYAWPNVLAMAVIVVGGFLPGDARVAAWITGIALFVYATIQAGSGSWIIRSGHFAERHGLIVIVAMGEVIVALGYAVVVELDDGFDDAAAGGIIALVAAGAFASLLWWSYFDRVGPALEHRAGSTPSAERGRYARDVYSYAHAPIVAGVILTAVAFEEMAIHPDEPTPAEFRTMAVIGITLFFGGITVAVYRAFTAVAKERLVAIGAIAILMLLAGDVNGVWLIVLIDLIVLTMLAAEHVRIEGRAAARESVDDGRVGDDAANQPLEHPPAG